jgi:DNA-binding response OmpR family regulator
MRSYVGPRGMTIERPPTMRARILVVEDEDGIRTALARWLGYEYEVATARDGVEGLAAATQKPAPDVILTDVWMPRLDGVSMVTRIKAIHALRWVPVIFLTDHTAPRSVIAGIAAGARAYLPKPVDLDVLDRKVRSALRASASANR